ncbi:acyl carrier protein [Tropicibacter oceani]|uniref:Acyl carrier protein n=1 Tax=Tropicibacter oceani TaxID=3058420 RepID=A0ABY8QGI4_9RHOB|nr:acyl carrier protein [Tropicibacter oceani]WGW03640.1 acyl carrier protein [Tropicibacter oceani]
MKAEQLQALVQKGFSEVLGRDVDAQTDFFDAGGDSLAAERLLLGLSKALGVELAGWMVLDHPTPEALSAALGQIA